MPTLTPKITARVRRRIRITYFCFHIICTVVGLTLIGLAYGAQKAEADDIELLKLNVTRPLAILFYIVGGAILLSTLVGVLGMLLENGYLWIVYSMLMVVICLAAVSGAGSALDQQGTAIRKEMVSLISRYKDKEAREEVERRVDDFQERYKCCGIDSYADWQDYEFGRTSLKVPFSCCIIPDDKNEVRDEFCGHLCLPDHVNLTLFVNVEGCFEKMAFSVRLTIIILGAFGIITFFLTGFIFTLTCYLIISKKMDTHK